MAYQVKRSKKFCDTLELCDENGNVKEVLSIHIDIDAVSKSLRAAISTAIEAEKQLKAVQKDRLKSYFEEALEAYGNAIVSVFNVALGEENTAKCLEFYEKRYIEMSMELIPYVYGVILPLVNEAISQNRQKLKYAYKGKR